jgi:hypothetical protein
MCHTWAAFFPVINKLSPSDCEQSQISITPSLLLYIYMYKIAYCQPCSNHERRWEMVSLAKITVRYKKVHGSIKRTSRQKCT